MLPANTLLPIFALLRIPGAAFQNRGAHKLLSARLLLQLSECFLHESMQKIYIFLPYHFFLLRLRPHSTAPLFTPFRPPIEVLNRGNSAFITVFVVETDDGTASSLIGAPNTFHARTTHNLIGRCAAERAFLALRLDVCFHLLLPPYNTPCNNP